MKKNSNNFQKKHIEQLDKKVMTSKIKLIANDKLEKLNSLISATPLTLSHYMGWHKKPRGSVHGALWRRW